MLYEVITAQVAYKSVYNKYTGSFDTLIAFIKSDSLPLVKMEGRLTDSMLEAVITSYSIHYTKLYERMMNSRADFHGPVNIGNPNEFSMLELAQLVIELTNSKSKIVYLPLPQDDPMQRQPDISYNFV